MLWVETQQNHKGLTRTIQIYNLFQNYNNPKEILGNWYVVEDGEEINDELGEYKTIERANEVYNEMVALLKDPFTELQDADGNTITVSVPWHYYKMPEK